MSRNIHRLGISLIGSAVVSLAVFACSSSSSKNTSDGGGSGGSSGSTGSGGASGSSGTTGSGGTASTDAGNPYKCVPPTPQAGTGTEGAQCCQTSIGKVGECVKPDTVDSGVQRAAFGHDTCSADFLCAPTPSALADAGSLGVYAPCRSTLGATGAVDLEGRCLPKCFVEGNPQAGQLKQDGCATADFVCAPCYNPIDGSLTGACSQNPKGDAPKEAAKVFKACGRVGDAGGPELGLCIPKAVITASGDTRASILKQHECASTDLCVPSLIAQNTKSCFVHCTITDATVSSVAGKEGACVPAFVAFDAAPQAISLLTKETCQTGEVCAPCNNPLGTPPGPSGACQ
jgi:hypothetical protein